MTYIFKLAHRLAQNFVVFGTAAALIACAADPTTPSVTPPDTTGSNPTQPPTQPPPPPPQPPSGMRVGYYVAPNGSSSAEGSVAHPWDLATALSGANGRVQPGDTVWLRAGTYSGTFQSPVAGVPGKPVVFRGYPGERATLNGRVRFDGADVVVWGFEIVYSQATVNSPGLDSRGARQKLINMVVHDGIGQGIRFWDEAVDGEMYGCIVYNNGTHENLDHGTYIHNSSGTKLIMDNVFFNNLAYGIHAYVSPSQGSQRNIHVVGNVAFNNGTISNNYRAKGNILIGGEEPGEGHRAIDNLMYYSDTAGTNMRIGYLAANRDIVVTGNTAFGGKVGLVVDNWTSATIQNNTFGGPVEMVDLRDSPSGHSWSGNRYYRSATANAWRTSAGAMTLSQWKSSTGLGATDQSIGSAPTATQVFVRPNKYEAGRALIVVYNWGDQSNVSVNLSGVLQAGQRYEVRNVQDLYGAAVTSGTYSGGSISVPMTGVNPPARIGRSTPTPPRTGPNFDTFVVVPLN